MYNPSLWPSVKVPKNDKSNVSDGDWVDDPRGDGWQFTHHNGKIIYRETPAGNSNASVSGSKTWQTGKEWCQETNDYREKDDVVKLKGIGSRLLRHGRSGLLFCVYPYRGMTAARVYKKKTRVHLSTKIFNREVTAEEARKLIFSSARTLKQVVGSGVKRPYKAIHRYVVMPKKDFDDKFNQNSTGTSTYRHTLKENRTLKNLSSIIDRSDGDEVSSGHRKFILNNCIKVFKSKRREYSGSFPCVELSAVWLNYDPETKLIHDVYDEWEPAHYNYHIFGSREDMDGCPL